MSGPQDRYKLLLARRVRREDIVLGNAYVIHARNGGVGVAVHHRGRLGYRLRREKFSAVFLFVEYDWDEDPNFGTAIPLKLLDADPPTGGKELVEWLEAQENENRAEIDAAWEVVLGHVPRSRRRT
jgi:hypothetical protein